MDTNVIARVSPEEVKAGELSRLFGKGSRAAILHNDDRIGTLCKLIFAWIGLDDPNAEAAEARFGKNLLDLARNHIAGNQIAGDLLRFEPGRIVHIARKFVIYRSAVDRSLRSFPSTFRLGDQVAPVPAAIMDLASTLMLEIFASSLSRSYDPVDYATQVEILRYPVRWSDVDAIGNLLADSCGRWSRWGNWIDSHRNNAYGAFDTALIRDIYGIACLLPKTISGLITGLNKRMASVSVESIPKSCFLLGRAHVDTGKYITALSGSRDNLVTEILDTDSWATLPVASDTLAIFPSPELTRHTEIRATSHRVLLYDASGNKNGAAQNISVSLSVIDRPTRLD
jgi:hypothetical protein